MAGGGAAPAGVSAVGRKATKTQERVAFGLITSLFFLWGFSYGLLDVLNKHFQTFFGITKLQSTSIQVAYFGAYIVYSPVAGQFMSRFGYKAGIYMGLALYSIGALCFWPSAKFEVFGGFVGAAFVIASGLATLEVAANSYVAVLGTPEQAAFRLNFSQSFNGLASFIGPLIASKYFFSDENSKSLTSVQYVYLAVACLGAAVAVCFFFCYLPEITESDMSDAQAEAGFVDERPLWKRWHCTLGFLTQLFYVGAQVTVASFVINYLSDPPHGSPAGAKGPYTSAEASRMFSYMQITFMVARFASTPLLRFFDPATLVTIYGTMCTLFSIVASFNGGKSVGLASLFIIFFFESIIYPTVFTLATSNLGKYTKRGASLVVMGVGGGAVFPPAQGAMADGVGTPLSYWIPAIGFMAVAAYGAGMRIYQSRLNRKIANNLVTDRPTLAHSGSNDKDSFEGEKIEAAIHV